MAPVPAQAGAVSVLPRSFVVAVSGPLLLLPLPGDGPPEDSAPPRAGPPVTSTTTTEPHGAGAGAARDRVSGEARPRWSWPLVPRPPVVRPYRAPAGPYGPGHRGADLGAGTGTEVLAVEGGVVTHAGRVAGRGTVTVLHAGGLSSTYEPVRARVVAGAEVDTGAVLGSVEPPVGPTGGHCVLTVCLHLGARRGTAYVDPVLLLAGGRMRLLPLGAGQPTTG